MRDILDLANIWTGTSGGAIVFTNKAPVANDDTLNVLRNSGAVTVAVLSNDVDPEDEALTLISASAALGTAVAEADNTVTYTPPPGITGFDTVVYEIADDLDQRQTGQINVTIRDSDLAINTLPDNTLIVVAAEGAIDMTVTQPSGFAGTTSFDTGNLQSGPVALAPPKITGSAQIGQVLSAVPGLWVYDPIAGDPTQSWQWQRSGADIAGATGATYTVAAADDGETLRVLETQTNTQGQRSAASAGLSASSTGFIPSVDPSLIAWYDASDTATLSGAAVSLWGDKAGTADLTQTVVAPQPSSGTRAQNGLNVVDFTGSDWMQAPLSLPPSGDVALHMAVIIDGVASQYGALVAFEAANDMQIDANSDTQFDGRFNAAGIGDSAALTGGPFGGPLILSAIFDRTGTGTVRIFVGNAERASAVYSTPLDPTAVLHLMTNRSSNAEVDGAVCEVVITGDITNRSSHHAYLASKWGMA
ncbi:MAG: Ig-like domain-containing protein [Pseudomonadota bacterium]